MSRFTNTSGGSRFGSGQNVNPNRAPLPTGVFGGRRAGSGTVKASTQGTRELFPGASRGEGTSAFNPG